MNDQELIFGCSKETYEYYREFGYGFYENEKIEKRLPSFTRCCKPDF